MGIGATDHWVTQARAGIARADATRANGVNLSVGITIGGSIVTSSVIRESLEVQQQSGDTPSTARFTLKPGSTRPTVGATVIIASALPNLIEFAGQIARVTCRHYADFPGKLWFDVECIDWHRLLDRRLITTEYVGDPLVPGGVSASSIAADIIATYTSGFTANAVVPGLGVDTTLPLVNVTPSEALRQLADLVGGGYYIDDYRDLHFYGPAGETFALPTPPLTLVDNLPTLKSFEHTEDLTQVRTSVYVEAQRTTTTAAVEAGDVVVPIEDETAFFSTGLARIGTEVVTFTTDAGSPMQLDVAAGLRFAHASGTEVVRVWWAGHAAAMAAWAAIEGGDGQHDYVLTNDRADEALAAALPQAELTRFAYALVSARWDTEDMNARPGRVQVINFTGVETLSASLPILRATVRWPLPDRPRRSCESGSAKITDLPWLLISANREKNRAQYPAGNG